MNAEMRLLSAHIADMERYAERLEAFRCNSLTLDGLQRNVDLLATLMREHAQALRQERGDLIDTANTQKERGSRAAR